MPDAIHLVAHVLLPIVAYLVGGIPFGYVAGRIKGIDLREQGSKNIGATNAMRVLGRKLGLAVFFADVFKGLLSVLAAGLIIFGPLADWADVHPQAAELAWVLTAAAAVLGHMFTPYLHFRGGKGVATTLGIVLGFWPHGTVGGLAAFATWAVVLKLSRYVSVASIVAAIVLTPLVALSAYVISAVSPGQIPFQLGFVGVICLLAIIKHRGNIRRLLAGQEPTIDQTRREKAEREVQAAAAAGAPAESDVRAT